MNDRTVFLARLLPVLLLWQAATTTGFTTTLPRHAAKASTTTSPTTTVVWMAGGFEWEDPTDEQFDQGVENPFKNPELLNSIKGPKGEGSSDEKDGEDDDENAKTIDPARLLGPRLQGSNLYLVGMMGTGKSVIGDKLARRMGTYKFLDTDDIIEKATKLKVTDIFESEGEEGFRNVEAQVLDTVHSYVRCVISTGGGLVTRTQNWGKLQTGIVIWLDVDPEIIYNRIKGNTSRPLLQTEDPLQTLKDLLEERRSKYSQGDFRIEVTTEMTENEVASRIVYDLHNYIDDNPPAWKLAKQKAQEEGLDWVK